MNFRFYWRPLAHSVPTRTWPYPGFPRLGVWWAGIASRRGAGYRERHHTCLLSHSGFRKRSRARSARASSAAASCSTGAALRYVGRTALYPAMKSSCASPPTLLPRTFNQHQESLETKIFLAHVSPSSYTKQDRNRALPRSPVCLLGWTWGIGFLSSEWWQMGRHGFLTQTQLGTAGISKCALQPCSLICVVFQGNFRVFNLQCTMKEQSWRERERSWERAVNSKLFNKGSRGEKTDLKISHHLILLRFSPPYASITAHWKCALITPVASCVHTHMQPLTFSLITLRYIHWPETNWIQWHSLKNWIT